MADESSGVDGGVVHAAEEGGVVEVGRAAVCPVDEVVGVGPAGGPCAAGEGAAAVADREGVDLGGGE